MRKIAEPTLTAETTYSICIEKVRLIELKSRLAACGPLIVEAEKELKEKVTKGLVHTIGTEDIVNKNVSSDDLVKVYTGRLSHGKGPGRPIYDALMLAPEQGLCPYCFQRPADTLDHYLPKTMYPRLAVVPINLVPICFACNKLKSSDFPKTPEEEFLHPYFDEIENSVWLVAEINETSPVSVSFFVDAPISWSELLLERVKYTFDKLKIGDLYSKQAAVLLRGLEYRIRSIYDASGETEVQKYLEDEAESRGAFVLNSWQAAFYRAASKSHWYITGGFRMQ